MEIMNKYERVRYNGRTIILKNPRTRTFCGIEALSGIHVDKEGDEIVVQGTDQKLMIIAMALVTKRTRLTLNKKYGELEVAK